MRSAYVGHGPVHHQGVDPEPLLEQEYLEQQHQREGFRPGGTQYSAGSRPRAARYEQLDTISAIKNHSVFKGYNDVRAALGLQRIPSMESKPVEIDQEGWDAFKQVGILPHKDQTIK